ncbi:MAG: CDGSH iron-sulfur domain-containing protein [bacterium]
MSDHKTARKTHETPMHIKVCDSGPYLVSGAVPLQEQIIESAANGEAVAWRAGARLETPDSYALCRCGQSENKPFCDGSHAATGFDGRETAGREEYIGKQETTKGPTMTMTDVEHVCAGARFCSANKGTWTLVEQSDDPKAAKLAREQACNCPSGRLTVYNKAGKAQEPELKPSIGVVEDEAMHESGPLWVRGGIPVESADGKTYRIRNRVTLCRCGKSANKPFCDGRHAE